MRKATLILLLAAAYVLPRAASLGGVETVDALSFDDMNVHLQNLDRLCKRLTLPAWQLEDPYLSRYPALLRTCNASRWPPGVYLAALPWAAIFGPASIWTTLLTNLLFSVILVLGLAGLGAAAGSRRTGLWAGALALLCPPLVASSWYFHLDYPLMAMTTVGLLLLWRTRGFSRLRPVLLLAAWSVAGQLIKPSYALYLLAPSLWTLLSGLRGAPSRRVVLINLALAAALAGLAPLALGPSPGPLLHDLRAHFTERLTAAQIEPWTLDWLLALPRSVFQSYPYPLLLAVLPGLVLLHTRVRMPLRGLLLSFLWGAYVLLTLMVNKLERYYHPLYPVLCLLSAWWVAALVARRWRWVVLTWIATAYAAVLVLVHQHPTPWSPWGGSDPRITPFFELSMPPREMLERRGRLGRHWSCRLQPMLDQLAALSRQEGSRRPLGVGILFEIRSSEAPGPLPGLGTETFVVQALQVIRDRIVLPVSLAPRPGWNVCAEWEVAARALPPSVLILHRPGADPRALRPELRLKAHRALVLPCEGDPAPIELGLYTPGAKK